MSTKRSCCGYFSNECAVGRRKPELAENQEDGNSILLLKTSISYRTCVTLNFQRSYLNLWSNLAYLPYISLFNHYYTLRPQHAWLLKAWARIALLNFPGVIFCIFLNKPTGVTLTDLRYSNSSLKESKFFRNLILQASSRQRTAGRKEDA